LLKNEKVCIEYKFKQVIFENNELKLKNNDLSKENDDNRKHSEDRERLIKHLNDEIKSLEVIKNKLIKKIKNTEGNRNYDDDDFDV